LLWRQPCDLARGRWAQGLRPQSGRSGAGHKAGSEQEQEQDQREDGGWGQGQAGVRDQEFVESWARELIGGGFGLSSLVGGDNRFQVMRLWGW